MKEKHIAEVRAFNRFYTGIIGLLDRYILKSRYSLPEVRVLYELYHHKNITASEIISSLQMDKGYLSRILQQFTRKRLVVKKISVADGRAVHLTLTPVGRNEFETLNRESDKQIQEILEKLSPDDCERLTRYMAEIRNLLT
ncbi:MAG TPA: MarR family winged helix-turn-helix transcriptional regulator [Chitinophagaceae bacterium]|nr:MarR family winged helix-turn-helix transcriptional regulator [Chitinophagaceae bacterium]